MSMIVFFLLFLTTELESPLENLVKATSMAWIPLKENRMRRKKYLNAKSPIIIVAILSQQLVGDCLIMGSNGSHID